MVPSLTSTGNNSGMSLKEVKRTAAVAWSPPLQTSPLLATGTLAGALDASFSTNAELEIHDLQLEDKSHNTLLTKTSVTCPSRFNRLAWSAHANSSGDGVIIGGCEDGSISFWSASDLLSQPNNEAALIARCEAHQGPVRGLQVNPFQPFLVASGATDAEIWLWDLNNLQQPYSPSANKSSKLEDITDLAWNRIVPHILATASNSGATVVWDLKSRKEVLQLTAPGQRVSMSAIAWNPENATQLLVASDDDQTPVIYSWDLRNARAPEKTLTGHAKGVLSLAWCPKDAELLLSCGKDSKSVCWNPKSGQIVAELTHSDNWIFDVQWCPRNPDLFSTASFSGTVEVNSFQTIMSGGGAAPASGAAAAGTAEDFFARASSGGMMAQRVSAPAHVQIPKWLRRPIGVSFGFGGRVISFSSLNTTTSSPRMVSITPLVLPTLAKVVTEGKRLDMALSSQMLVDYCQAKIPRPIPNLHVTDREAIFWNVAKVLFESNPQEKLLTLLGFDQARLEEQIKSLCISHEGLKKQQTQLEHERLQEEVLLKHTAPTTLKSSSSPTSPASAIDYDFFAGGPANGLGEGLGEGADFDFQSLVGHQEPEETPPETMAARRDTDASLASRRRGTFDGTEFQLFAPECSDLDRTITRAIIQGNFEGAVDLCVQANRLSDALLVAICGGEQLVARTQQLYFRQSHHPYLRIVSAIVKRDLTDVVTYANVEDWEEILALICTYSSGPAFSQLCSLLAGRLEATLTKDNSLTNAKAPAALICYMAAGNAGKAVGLLLREASAAGTVPDRHFQWPHYAVWLEGLVEKTRIIEQIAGYVRGTEQQQPPIQDALPEISDKFIEYSGLMASVGLLDIAVRYFNSFSNERPLEGDEMTLVTDPVVLFGDQLAKAAKTLGLPLRPIPEPFATPVSVTIESAAGPAPATVQTPPAPQAATTKFPTQFPPPSQSMSSIGAPPSFGHPIQSAPSMQAPPGPGPFQSPMMYPPPTHQSQPPTQPPASSVMPSSSQFARPPITAPVATGRGESPTLPVRQPQPSTSMGFGSMSAGYGAPLTSSARPPATAMSSQPTVSEASVYATAPVMSSSASQPSMATTADAASFIPLPRPIGTGGSAIVPAVPTPPSPTGVMPSIMVPAPPRPVVSPPPSSDVSSRRSVGAYNDPPIVAPRIPMGAAAPVVAPSAPVTMGPTVSTASASVAATAPSAPASVAAAPKPSQGPVDPSKIPSNLMPIYKTFSTLIIQCQERALPMQRRVVEDSARRMQALFQQLVDQQLSPPVVQILMDMCTHINNGQYDRAHEMHTPLMTSYFAEAGAWVLAAKRLIEVAKISLH